MEIWCFLIWIDAFFWTLADSFSNIYTSSYCYGGTWDYTTQSYTNKTCYYPSAAEDAVEPITAAIAGLSGCVTILFLVSMIVVSVFIARHRSAGGHCKLGSPAPAVAGPPLMAQTDLELRQQNLALQQQYITLQQQHLELQRQTGFPAPPAVAHIPGQENFARDPEMGMERGHEQQGFNYAAYSEPSRGPVSEISSLTQPQQQPEMSQKGKERAVYPDQGESSGHMMSGAQPASEMEHGGDDITPAPIVR
jgi:hypothetical protein